jgi:hypothetical protein
MGKETTEVTFAVKERKLIISGSSKDRCTYLQFEFQPSYFSTFRFPIQDNTGDCQPGVWVVNMKVCCWNLKSRLFAYKVKADENPHSPTNRQSGFPHYWFHQLVVFCIPKIYESTWKYFSIKSRWEYFVGENGDSLDHSPTICPTKFN